MVSGRGGHARARFAVTDVVYPDEGHGFLQPESRASHNNAIALCHASRRSLRVFRELAGSRLEVRESIRPIAGVQNIGHVKLNRAACWPYSLV
jgi:hypothetical protein